MNILIIGSGAREHALAWKLRQSLRIRKLCVAPGNAGTAAIATNLPIEAAHIEALAEAAKQNAIDLTVVGPEGPLAEGMADYFQHQGLRIFGPSRAAARIESSKTFARELMTKYGIPQPSWKTFDSYRLAREYVQSCSPPIVIKADGLAAGKGVTVAKTRDEALKALHTIMVARVFGSAGDRVLVEECLSGREVSVFALTDGTTVVPFMAACDYKRVYDGDQGPNTGGMGSYSPPEFLTDRLAQQIHGTIMVPTVRAMTIEGKPYVGFLYGGLMITPQGPKVLEFNCRLGDPEAQAVLPLLQSDLLDLLLATVEGNLGRVAIRWRPEACVAVVLASKGYPESYDTGFPVQGLHGFGDDALVFHAGTKHSKGTAVTAGGRVLTVAALGKNLSEARKLVYSQVAGISFQGCHYRRDIAYLAEATAW